jgi:F-type H+-transporting ATPase subunit gamma
MPSLKDIRKRIASVKNTQKITRAMKLVAAAKLRRAQNAMQELRPYAEKHRELLGSLASQLRATGMEDLHPLMTPRSEVKSVGVLAINSDRGMCGAFNGSLQKALLKLVAEKKAAGVETVRIYTIGKRVGQFVSKRDLDHAANHGEVIGSADSDRLPEIVEGLTRAYLDGEVDEVIVLSNRFKSAIAQVPTAVPVLPVSGDDTQAGAGEAGGDLLYEPGQEALLQYVVPRYVEVQVRQAILESIAGEFAARMNAMTTATDNASDMISELTLQANRARQAAITKELMEIIGGAEAMN